MRRHTSDRIVVVGGGVAGLAIAGRLAQNGLPVTVLEASGLGAGASNRNQGWLHSGAWFAPQQQDLAELCYASYQQTLRFSPDCIEADSGSMVYLLSREATDPASWTAAWQAAGIPYRPLTTEQLFDRFPGLAIRKAQTAFELPDRAIAPNVLLRRLAEAAEHAGAEIRANTAVTGLVQQGSCVQGVKLGPRDTLAARLVIVAGNARGGRLLPDFGAQAVGADHDVALVALKTHLVSVRSELCRWPLCVVDADGFNHLPHGTASVFGTTRWLPGRHGEDDQPSAEEIQRLWRYVDEFFPHWKRSDSPAIEWAGSTVQAMWLQQLEAGQVPVPVVVDHQQEPRGLENLLSVFPGRASLWPYLAEETLRCVVAKVGQHPRSVAPPPWGTAGGPAPCCAEPSQCNTH